MLRQIRQIRHHQSMGKYIASYAYTSPLSHLFVSSVQVTAPKSGAEVIPFIKTYVNLPVAIVSKANARQHPCVFYTQS